MKTTRNAVSEYRGSVSRITNFLPFFFVKQYSLLFLLHFILQS